jgi:hypothetical protein
MASHESRDRWSANPTGGRPPPEVDLVHKRQGPSAAAALGGALKKLIGLAILVAIGWGLWRFGRPLVGRMKMNADVEGAATSFARLLPEKVSTREELVTAVTAHANDRLQSFHAKKARWHVAYGKGGKDLSVIRDDQFTALEKAFVARVFGEAVAKAGPPTAGYHALEYPLGAVVERVDLEGEAWYVAAVWTE